MEAIIFGLVVVGLWAIGKHFFKAFGRSGISRQETLAKYGIGTRRQGRQYLTYEKPNVILSAESQAVLGLLENSRQNLFITGKAGTGKSTLLQYFRATTKKQVVVVAPTGVAALNIEGQTVHRFFKFKPGITTEKVRKIYGPDVKLYKKVDMLVIDEISMVRADLFDCIEKFLYINGPRPGQLFGGVQIVVFGDLYQLPPVVKQEEKVIFQNFYQGPYFFDSLAYKKAGFLKKELTYVYRQSDLDFVSVLDAVRTGNLIDSHLEQINSRVSEVEQVSIGDGHLTMSLVPTNALANTINFERLTNLSGKVKQYVGILQGEFEKMKDESENKLPTQVNLSLKEGAQVMLLNNDPRGKWVNGTLAKVVSLGSPGVRVLFEDGTFDDIGPFKWEMIKYVLDEADHKIKSEVVGTYTQLPMRLAWAVTMHKAQGKTYDRITIDFGSGTFAPGQAYVALSRCRSLEGLTLRTPLIKEHVFVDERVKEFMK